MQDSQLFAPWSRNASPGFLGANLCPRLQVIQPADLISWGKWCKYDRQTLLQTGQKLGATSRRIQSPIRMAKKSGRHGLQLAA